MEIGFQIKKLATISTRRCYKTVYNHPFLVAVVFFLIFLRRSFPFLFSLLVSASPIVVCSIVLIGTLLSFDQLTMPETKKQELATREIKGLKVGTSNVSSVVERDDNFRVPIASEVEEAYGNFVYSVPLIKKDPQKIRLEKQVPEGVEIDLDDSEIEMMSEMEEEGLGNGEGHENQHSQINNIEEEKSELQHDISPRLSDYSHVAEYADSPPESPVEDVDDEGTNAESDWAGSCSPDASMSGMIPMLDEIHPLLDEDAPQPASVYDGGSDADSETSKKSSDATNESDEDSESQKEEACEDDSDENDDYEGEEGTQNDKEDGTKSSVTWTEDDQKNFTQLGTSELERNERLENLIPRRSMRWRMTEKKLAGKIADPPFDIPSISTRRINPFDLPYDHDGDTGLPPIPESAPSILLKRGNPFDLPFDLSSKKPEPVEESFPPGIMSLPPKEIFLRRHESFNVGLGPSLFGPSKLEKQEIKLRPYFLPERLPMEWTSYSSIRRQPSESSVPETDSICSDDDEGDNNASEEGSSQEVGMILDPESASEHVGHGSESSDDVHAVELGQVESRGTVYGDTEIRLGGVKSHPVNFCCSSETPVDYSTSEIHLNNAPDEVNCSSRSSLSSLSEVAEVNLDPKMENPMEDFVIAEETSQEHSGSDAMIALADDSQHEEPVYDSSPQSIQRNLSSSRHYPTYK